MAEVKVNLGDRSYNIYIDVANMNVIGKLLQNMNVSQKVLVVSDDNVGQLYGMQLITILNKCGFMAELYCVPSGEHSKNIDVAMSLYAKAITMGLERKSSIVALGGGVIGDLAGFVASTYLRGISFVQIPTSLLAQVDSSVGGKVAVNHPLGKNLIGSFYQPKVVLIDVELLNTLPERELYTGLAEVIKYGVIADRDFFTYLNENAQQILEKQPDFLTDVIRQSCEIKAKVVEQDERESSLRIILNFGHTIGHAIEACTGFNRYNHGEAVAIGMYGAALISHYLGMCSKAAVAELRSIITKFKLPLTAPECEIDELLVFLVRDKKVVENTLNWVLMNDIGQVCVYADVPEDIVRKALADITEKVY